MKTLKKNKNSVFLDQEVTRTEIELVRALGDEIDVDVKLSEVIPEKKEFTVSASVYGLEEPLHITQKGKSLRDSLLALKKSVVRRVRAFTSRKISLKRRNRKAAIYKESVL